MARAAIRAAGAGNGGRSAIQNRRRRLIKAALAIASAAARAPPRTIRFSVALRVSAFQKIKTHKRARVREWSAYIGTAEEIKKQRRPLVGIARFRL